MKPIIFSAVIGCFILLNVGCSWVPLKLKEDGEHIAASLGEDREDLRFVSYADISPAAKFSRGFGPHNRGAIVVSQKFLYWQNSLGEFDPNSPFFKIPLNHVNGFGVDQKLIQLKLDSNLHVLRLVGPANGSYSSAKRALMFNEVLTSLSIAEFTPQKSLYEVVRAPDTRPTSSRRPSDSGQTYDSPSDVIFQDNADRDHFKWVSTYGDDGALTTPR